MEHHPISDLFKISLDCIKDMIDVNTICGDAIKINEDISVIPVSKVRCTFVTGGLDQSDVRNPVDNKYPFGGATGGTLVLNPIAFLVCTSEGVNLLHLSEETHLYEKIIDAIPTTINQIKDFFQKNPEVTNLEIIERKKTE